MKKKIIRKKEKESGYKKKKGSFLNTTSGVVVITILIAAAISAAAYYGFVGPQLDKVGVGREFDVATAANSLQQETAFLDSLKSLRKNFNAISRNDIEILAQMLPIDRSTPELLAQLETMARQTGVSLKRVNMTEVEEAAATARQRLQREVQAGQAKLSQDIVEVIVQIDITAFDYRTFKNFVLALQNHRRILDLDNIFFQTDQDNQKLTIKTYFLKQ